MKQIYISQNYSNQWKSYCKMLTTYNCNQKKTPNHGYDFNQEFVLQNDWKLKN